MQLLFENSAVKYCLEQLKYKGYDWNSIKYINENRYAIVQGKTNIAIVFKKAWFMKFGEMGFVNDEGLPETGIGDSLNVEDIKKFIANKVSKIYIVYQDGKIYWISLVDYLLHSFRWTNKESKEVRSISIHHYIRLEE